MEQAHTEESKDGQHEQYNHDQCNDKDDEASAVHALNEWAGFGVGIGDYVWNDAIQNWVHTQYV